MRRTVSTTASTIGELGGLPSGLMVHLARPDGDGFPLSNVWRSDAEMRPFLENMILPKLADAGLGFEEPVISPVWGIARP